MKSKFVTLITINYNHSSDTIDCVDSILKSTYDNFKIFIVDNGSKKEDFRQLIQEYANNKLVEIVRMEMNKGYVGGVNFGLEKAASVNPDYFLIMNNDTLIDNDAIKELVYTGEKYNGNAIVSGKVYNYDEKDTLQYIGQGFDKEGMLNHLSIIKNRKEKDVGQYDIEMEMGMLDDIFWLVSKRIYSKLGKYSDYFFLYGEQNDYGLRALNEGFKMIYTPKAKLWHKEGSTTCDGEKKSAKIIYWTTFATLKLSVLHFPEEKANSFFYKWVFRNTIKRLFYFITAKDNFPILKAHFLAVKHFKHWNLIRYKDNGYNPFN